MTAFALLAAATAPPPLPPTPLPASADKELSARCLIQFNLIATNEKASAEERELGEAGTLYWLGRMNAESPDQNAVTAIPDIALRLNSENLKQEGEYCGSEFADRRADMDRAAKRLKELRQAAEALHNSK